MPPLIHPATAALGAEVTGELRRRGIVTAKTVTKARRQVEMKASESLLTQLKAAGCTALEQLMTAESLTQRIVRPGLGASRHRARAPSRHYLP